MRSWSTAASGSLAIQDVFPPEQNADPSPVTTTLPTDSAPTTPVAAAPTVTVTTGADQSYATHTVRQAHALAHAAMTSLTAADGSSAGTTAAVDSSAPAGTSYWSSTTSSGGRTGRSTASTGGRCSASNEWRSGAGGIGRGGSSAGIGRSGRRQRQDGQNLQIGKPAEKEQTKNRGNRRRLGENGHGSLHSWSS